jgi:hypothetical protein
MRGNETKIHLLNIALMAIALVLAFLIPFQLFLFAYAMLGPLHYLTEINWLNRKGFYLENKKGIWILVGLTFLASCPILFSEIEILHRYADAIPVLNFLSRAYATIVLLTLAACLAMVYKNKGSFVISLILTIVLIIFLFRNTSAYYLFGALIPSLVHVYLFTLIFMAYGITKTKNRVGLLEVMALATVPILIAYLPIDNDVYVLGNKTLLTFRESKFGELNINLARVLNITTDRNSEFIFSVAGIKIQIFIAFAYLYHYLNWFSKISLIGWIRNASVKEMVVLGMLWVISISTYFYDYGTGLALLFFLSLLHVTLEFPLNVLSIQGLLGFIFDSFRSTRREGS